MFSLVEDDSVDRLNTKILLRGKSMKTIIKSKIMMALVVLTFAFASAQNSITLKLTGQTKVERVGGTERGEADFVNSGSNIDDFSIGFKAVLDNVTASVTIEDDGDDDGSDLGFDSAYIEVADLFDGLLTLKFFDIGYAAGYDNSIRPDLGSHGIKFTLKPIDMLSISLGYGINENNIYIAAGTDTNASTENNADRPLHLIQLDVGINNAFVPATIYFGTVIADGGDITGLKVLKKAGEAPEKVTIAHMSAGFTADLLASLLAGAVNLDLGVVFPLFGAATYIDQTKTEYENELNLVAVLHGDVANLGVEGLGLAYDLVFALDSHTKHTTLDDMDGTANSDTFYDLFKVDVTPSYTLGQFKIALNFVFGMVGENTALAAGSADAFNRYEITPSVTWSPAEIASIKGYFTYEEPNSETDDDEFMTLGLDYTATIGVSGL